MSSHEDFCLCCKSVKKKSMNCGSIIFPTQLATVRLCLIVVNDDRMQWCIWKYIFG